MDVRAVDDYVKLVNTKEHKNNAKNWWDVSLHEYNNRFYYKGGKDS